jgi:hypothetical protein
MFVAENSAALAERFVFPEQSPDLVSSLISKREMFHLATKLGIPTARAVFPGSLDDAKRLLDSVPLPSW